MMDMGRQLAQQIANTKEFNEFKQAQKNIENHPHLKKELEVFQIRQMEIVSKAASPQEAEQKMAQLNRQFESLFQVPEVRKIVNAGERFNAMMVNIYREINENLEAFLRS